MPYDDNFTWRPEQHQPGPPWSEPPRRPPQAARKPPRSFLIPFLTVLVLLLAVLVLRDYWSRWFDHTDYGNPRPVTARGELAPDEQATIDIYKQSRPSVVHITTLKVQRDSLNLNVQQVP